jgi:hypothetical protein
VDEFPPLPTTGFDGHLETADAETGEAISSEALDEALEGFWDDDDDDDE